MMAKGQPRAQSYGQQRSFRGLEDFAIRRRLQRARQFLDQLRTERPMEPLQVLELGCGYWGANLQALRQEHGEIKFTGVDLAVAQDAGGIDLIQADLENWAPERRYDAVLSLAVAEHLLNPASHFALIARCLTAGGRAGISTPAPQADIVLMALARLGIFDAEEIADHKLYLTQRGLTLCAERAGLVVEVNQRFSMGMNQWLVVRKE